MKCFVRVRLAFLPFNSRPVKTRERPIRIAAARENCRMLWNNDWIFFFARRCVIKSDFQANLRNFLQTIGVRRRERSARRCMVRTPSLQLWAILRQSEPHNELTILPSISKLAVYLCRALYSVSISSFSLCSPSTARDREGMRDGYRKLENNVW